MSIRFRYLRRLSTVLCWCLPLICIYYSVNSHAQKSAEEGLIKIHTGGWTDFLERYHKQSLLHLLDLTVDELGPYQVKFSDKESTWHRVQQEIAKGGYAHMEITAEPKPLDAKKIIHLPFKNLRGLLGLRRLIARKQSAERFINIQSFSDFQTLKAGQVGYWPDNRIYEYSKIPLAKSVSYNKIFPMLVNKRFDYLPLGMLEADDELSAQTQYKDNLTVLENIFIFYPLQTYISVSVNNVPLVDRLVKGLVLLRSDEQEPMKFQEYFKEYIENIDADNSLLVMLPNPDFSKDQNKQTIESALSRYFSDKTQVINVPL